MGWFDDLILILAGPSGCCVVAEPGSREAGKGQAVVW